MALDKHAIEHLYRRRAARYDFTANLYYLIGFREARYRRKAVDALKLRPGDTVVEIGCGTGLNFPYLIEAIGPEGTLIGVDLTAAMLDKARKRVDTHGWRNVRLVQSDAAAYLFPDQVDGVISSFALTLVPEYDQVILRAQKALRPGGRLCVLDLKLPENWPAGIARLAVFVTRPFGVTPDLAQRRPWEAMQTRFSRVDVTPLYGGFAYIAVAITVR